MEKKKKSLIARFSISTATAILSIVMMVISVFLVSFEYQRLCQTRKLYTDALENTLEIQKLLDERLNTLDQMIEENQHKQTSR